MMMKMRVPLTSECVIIRGSVWAFFRGNDRYFYRMKGIEEHSVGVWHNTQKRVGQAGRVRDGASKYSCSK